MGAASRAIWWPTAAEPVNETAPMRSSVVRVAPTSAPPVSNWRALSGAPAAAQRGSHQVDEPEGRERGLRGGLHDDRAAGGEARGRSCVRRAAAGS